MNTPNAQPAAAVPSTSAPRLVCTAVSVVTGEDLSVQEQVQFMRLPGSTRLVTPRGPYMTIVTDDPAKFGQFTPGWMYEILFNFVPIAREELVAQMAEINEVRSAPDLTLPGEEDARAAQLDRFLAEEVAARS